jgi:hypothetical protein
MSCPTCGGDGPETGPRCTRCGTILDPVAGPAGVTFLHAGSRYAIGQGTDFYGIWDLVTRGPSLDRFTMTRRGWSAAWTTYSALEKGYERRSMSVEHRADHVVPRPAPPMGRVLVGAGGLAVAISAFLRWIDGTRAGHATLVALSSTPDHRGAIAWLVPVLGVAAVLVALTLPRAVRTLGIALGLLVIGIAGYLFVDRLHGLTGVHAVSDIGAGTWTAVAGVVLMIVGGTISG